MCTAILWYMVWNVSEKAIGLDIRTFDDADDFDICSDGDCWHERSNV